MWGGARSRPPHPQVTEASRTLELSKQRMQQMVEVRAEAAQMVETLEDVAYREMQEKEELKKRVSLPSAALPAGTLHLAQVALVPSCPGYPPPRDQSASACPREHTLALGSHGWAALLLPGLRRMRSWKSPLKPPQQPCPWSCSLSRQSSRRPRRA